MTKEEQELQKKFPETTRLKAVREDSHRLGEFMEWLSENGYTLCVTLKGDHEFTPARETIEQLLSKYFEIDPKKLENERQAMLDELRASQGIG